MKTWVQPLALVRPREARHALGRWLRLARQRMVWTQAMLASKAGVPVATLSRLEREGEGSIDAVFRALQALGELDGVNAFVQERLRLASLPSDLADIGKNSPVRQRIRPAKNPKGGHE